jgi:Tfp pilus assembly protein PilN
MKRLNLLPPELRPRTTQGTTSYAVIGGLLAMILAMFAYGLVQAGANSKADEISDLHKETAAAKEDASALGPYAQFAAMKDARARSVRLVADTRFDYERLTRELTQILPKNVWITGLEVGPADLNALTEGADSAAAADASGDISVSVSGCAPSQPTVADTLDRLGALTGATGVELSASGDGSAAGGQASDSGDGATLVDAPSGAGCGGGMGSVSFGAVVAITPPQAKAEAL